MFKQTDRWVSLVFAILLLASARLGFGAFPAPPLPSNPSPADAENSAPVNTLLQWQSHPANPAPSPVAAPKVLILNTYTSSYYIDKVLGSVRDHFTNFTTVNTSTTTPAVLASLLADKQILLVPWQEPDQLSMLGTVHGPVIRQFVQAGGLVIAYGIGCRPGPPYAPFMVTAGLMNVVWDTNSSNSGKVLKLASSHPVTQDIPVTFSLTMDCMTFFNRDPGAEVILRDAGSDMPVALLKTIGTGHVLLIGWWQTDTNIGLLAANAFRQMSVCNGTDFISHDVYLGTTNPPTTMVAQNIFVSQFSPGTLNYGTYYYWKVVEHNSGGDTNGPIWSFQTPPLPKPTAPSAPVPVDQAIGIPLTQQLAWNPGSIPATYSVRLGTANPPATTVASGLTQPKYSPSGLANNTTYYWQVVSTNGAGAVEGPVWSFTTPTPPPVPNTPLPADGATSVSIDMYVRWNTTYSGPALTPAAVPNVLVWNRYTDAVYTNNVLAAIRSRFPNFTTTMTSTTTPSVLQAQLADKQVFLITPQNKSAFYPYGTAFGPTLRQFVKSGGLIIVCDYMNAAPFLANADLMYVTYATSSNGFTAKSVSSNPVMEDCPTTFATVGRNVLYLDSDGEVLLRDASSDRPHAIIKTIGEGRVLLIGSMFDSYLDEMAIIPANAMRLLGRSRGTNFTSYDLYFDTVNPPVKQYAAASYADSYSTSTALSYQTNYYWKVVAHTPAGDAAGPVWSFRTINPPAPQQPWPIYPYNNTTIGTARPFMSWNPGAYPATYSVRIDTVNPPVAQVATGLMQPMFIPNRLAGGTKYYWQIVAHNISGDTAGPVSAFTTPAAPLAPVNPIPASAATSISTRTLLEWRGTPVTSPTVQVAVLTGYGHYKSSTQVSNMIAAIQAGFTNFQTEYMNQDDTPTLAATLDRKHVLIVPEQNASAPGWTWAGYGTQAGPILRKFVEDGGLVVVLNGTADSGSDAFLSNAGLMSVSNWSSINFRTLDRVSYHKILEGVPSTFSALPDACSFRVLDGGQVLFKDRTEQKPVAAIKSIGAGNALVLGWNYQSYNTTLGRILSNAINMLGKPGNEYYDVYFGTSNPPTSLLQTTNSLSVSPGTLNYATNYYWKVVAHNAGGDAPGAVWSFRTGPVPIPGVPSNPTPPANQLNVDPATKLQWSATANTTSYDVYFGTTTPPTTKIVDHGTATECAPPLNYSTTYFWRVVAHNAYADTNGPVWGFRTMNLPKPSAPSNPSPADGSINVATNAILTWAAGSIPATFSVKFGTTNPPTTVIASGLSQPTCNPGALQLSKTYYWQVTATNASGSTAGPVWSFATPPAPGAPSNPSPAADALNVDPRTKLQWAAAANATNYDVYFGTTNPPTALIVDHGADTQCTATLAYATTYFWRVVARNAYGETSGAVWGFRTMNLPKPDAPSNPLPENNAVYVPTTTTLSWNPGSFPATYSIKLGMSNPPFIQIATGLTQPSFKPVGLGPASTYYWQVTATNATGTTAGPVWKFTTPGPPFTPANPAPSAAAKKVPLNAKLTWSGIPELPVNILVFTGHSDNNPTGEYQKTLAAIRRHFTNFTVTETTSENPATIAAQLAGKQVFLVPEQENWTSTAMSGFGSALHTVLQNFNRAGGLVLVCDAAPVSGGGAFLYNAGLMLVTQTTTVGQTTAKVGPADPSAITQGVAPTFACYNAQTYSLPYGGWSLVRQVGTNNGIVVMDPYNGYGASILIGWDFDQYNDDMALVIANAIRFYGGASRANETYDIYFGTNNPPTMRIAVGIACAPMAPPAMLYGWTYYWYVVAKNAQGTATGATWSFTTTGKTAIPRTDWSCYE
ncbi:hypothetical protein LLG95_12225 [bacterium]|nr:hypothetical protein [bacterium]